LYIACGLCLAFAQVDQPDELRTAAQPDQIREDAAIPATAAPGVMLDNMLHGLLDHLSSSKAEAERHLSFHNLNVSRVCQSQVTSLQSSLQESVNKMDAFQRERASVEAPGERNANQMFADELKKIAHDDSQKEELQRLNLRDSRIYDIAKQARSVTFTQELRATSRTEQHIHVMADLVAELSELFSVGIGNTKVHDIIMEDGLLGNAQGLAGSSGSSVSTGTSLTALSSKSLLRFSAMPEVQYETMPLSALRELATTRGIPIRDPVTHKLKGRSMLTAALRNNDAKNMEAAEEKTETEIANSKKREEEAQKDTEDKQNKLDERIEREEEAAKAEKPLDDGIMQVEPVEPVSGREYGHMSELTLRDLAKARNIPVEPKAKKGHIIALLVAADDKLEDENAARSDRSAERAQQIKDLRNGIIDGPLSDASENATTVEAEEEQPPANKTSRTDQVLQIESAQQAGDMAIVGVRWKSLDAKKIADLMQTFIVTATTESMLLEKEEAEEEKRWLDVASHGEDIHDLRATDVEKYRVAMYDAGKSANKTEGTIET
jgi:hypothetical protein